MPNTPREATWPFVRPKNMSTAPAAGLVGPPFPVPVQAFVGPPYPMPETPSPQADTGASASAAHAPTSDAVTLTPAGPSPGAEATPGSNPLPGLQP
jgi:hypothetical protein